MNLRLELAASAIGLVAGVLLLVIGAVAIMMAQDLETEVHTLVNLHRETAAKADEASRECYSALAASIETAHKLRVHVIALDGRRSVEAGLAMTTLFGFLVVRLRRHRVATGV